MPAPKTFQSLEANSITVTFGGVNVVRSVDLLLRPGEIHAITGENGAGKSSLAKVIGGVYRPRSGELRLNGRPVKFKTPREAMKAGIALIHQEPLGFPDLDIAENIFVGHHPTRAGRVDWKAVYSESEKILRELGSTIDPRSKLGGLSVAQQQMVELACALSLSAQVWIFDETTAPLTPIEVAELFAIMRRLRNQGCAIAIVTHHLDEIFEIADHITVLRDGQKIAERSPADTDIDEIVKLMVGPNWL